MPALLDRRLIFVTGKGGVGKSTVASALGLLAARRGLRTIVAELSSQDRIQRTFEPPGQTAHENSHASEHFQEVELAPSLFTISIDPQLAMEEYLRLRIGPLGHVLASSRLFGAFAMATPGMRELLSVGKVWELAQLERRSHGAASYDLVIVDASATGHGVAALRTPQTFAEIARVGPIAHQGRTIAATIADHEFTAVVAVTTAEEMPVNETLTLRDALEGDQLHLDAVIVNAMYPARFEDDQVAVLAEAAERRQSQVTRVAVRAALSEHARAAAQLDQRARLADGLEMELIELPYLFAHSFGRAELELLADALATELAGRA